MDHEQKQNVTKSTKRPLSKLIFKKFLKTMQKSHQSKQSQSLEQQTVISIFGMDFEQSRRMLEMSGSNLKKKSKLAKYTKGVTSSSKISYVQTESKSKVQVKKQEQAQVPQENIQCKPSPKKQTSLIHIQEEVQVQPIKQEVVKRLSEQHSVYESQQMNDEQLEKYLREISKNEANQMAIKQNQSQQKFQLKQKQPFQGQFQVIKRQNQPQKIKITIEQVPKLKITSQPLSLYEKFQHLYSRTIPQQLEEQSSLYLSESHISQTQKIQDFNIENGAFGKKLSELALTKEKQEKLTDEQLAISSTKRQKELYQNAQQGDRLIDFVLTEKKLPSQTEKSPQVQLNLKKVTKKLKTNDPPLQYVQQQYQNGGRYCGYMLNGLRNGQGKFFYKNGGYYEGSWKNNSMNGFGKLFYDNGKIAYEGQWYQDEFHGKGKVYNDCAQQLNGYFDYRDFNQSIENYWQRYEGQLSHDIKAGFGKIYLSNGEWFEGQFRDDNAHGKGKFYSLKNGGQIIRGVWNSGILVKLIQVISVKDICWMQPVQQDHIGNDLQQKQSNQENQGNKLNENIEENQNKANLQGLDHIENVEQEDLLKVDCNKS